MGVHNVEDLTNKKTMTKTNTMTMTMTNTNTKKMTKTFREHPYKVTLDTCDP